MRRLAPLVAAMALVATACGGGHGHASSTGSSTVPPTTAASSSTPSTVSLAGRRYVSLGDSYSAGQGLPLGTGPCGRAPGAYPSLVSTRAGLDASLHACNGATTADVIDDEQVPGVGKQIDAVTAAADIVTITIGGNDIGFAQVMTDCVLGSLPCTRLDSQVSADLATLATRLPAVYGQIRARAPHAQLIVVGYPQLVIDPATSSLASCAGLTPDESRFVRAKGDELAQAIETATAAAGGHYVDAAAAFAGHEACSAVPWMEGVDLVDIGSSFHPNAAGQEQLAQLVLAAIQGH